MSDAAKSAGTVHETTRRQQFKKRRANAVRDGSLERYAPVAVVPLVVGFWLLGVVLFPHVIASPAAALSSLVSGWERGWVQEGLRATFGAVAMSFVACAVGGTLVGLSLALSKFWGDVFEPVLLWMFSMPKLIFYPIVMLYFGIGVQSTTAFAILSGILPVTIIVFSAVRTVPVTHLKVAHVYGLGRRQVFGEIIIPVVLPSLVTALRYGFSLSFIGVILAEMFAARQGFGQVLMGAMFIDDTSRVFGIASLLVVVAFAINSVFLVWQRRVEASMGRGGAEDAEVWPAAI